MYDIDALDNRDEGRIRRYAEVLGPFLDLWFDPVVRGLEQIPKGPALYVGNHNGGTLTPDSFVFVDHLLRSRSFDDVPYGLMHEVAMMMPGAHQFFIPLGGVRASHENAMRLFEGGHKALVYPGGDIDAMRPYRHRDRVVFGNRRGYIRLALRSGVPIVPVVAAGAHETFYIVDDGRWLAARLGPLTRLARLKVWPVTLSIPWGLTVGVTLPYFPAPSKILMEVLEPVAFDRTGEEAAADADYVEACHLRVHTALQKALVRLVKERDVMIGKA